MILRLLLPMLMLCCWGDVVIASSEFGAIPVRSLERRAVTRDLRAALPEARHVVIFVHAEQARSQAFLKALRREGYPGYRTTIVLAAAEPSRVPGAIDLSDWQEAQVLRADLGSTRGFLSSGALPAIVGVDDTGKVIWRRSGQQRQAVTQVRQMLEWLQ